MKIAAALFAATFAGSLLAPAPALALTMKECAAKFDAAKKAGATKPWNDFRKAECGADATPAAAKATNAVFPKAVDKKYASEKPHRARMKTCLDQYNANKAGVGNGGLNWIQKGGGYYSQCNKALKGSAA